MEWYHHFILMLCLLIGVALPAIADRYVDLHRTAIRVAVIGISWSIAIAVTYMVNLHVPKPEQFPTIMVRVILIDTAVLIVMFPSIVLIPYYMAMRSMRQKRRLHDS